MNLQEWRAKQQTTNPVTLPSGLDVILRQVDVVDLAAQGQIPSTLSAKVTQSITTGEEFVPTMDDIPSMRTVFVAVAKAAIVEPEELDVETELPFPDLAHIFNWCNGEAAQLATFHREPTEPVGNRRNGQAVRAKAERFRRLEG